jgi:hypothetical protein
MEQLGKIGHRIQQYKLNKYPYKLTDKLQRQTS